MTLGELLKHLLATLKPRPKTWRLSSVKGELPLRITFPDGSSADVGTCVARVACPGNQASEFCADFQPLGNLEPKQPEPIDQEKLSPF
ncbi:hypothetical protein KUV26_17965 [Leisingera daeponensis]|uniref:Uncharacterized protein n=1 Tax=Leisingera daeponensis TaxID=405746 RepID=A0ABS7NJE4_9RHOB|nr:hypothetical protein [Leisingera daeponensis]MBY6141328.1 hypothetical protein [Leisingera daeponensis]